MTAQKDFHVVIGVQAFQGQVRLILVHSAQEDRVWHGIKYTRQLPLLLLQLFHFVEEARSRFHTDVNRCFDKADEARMEQPRLSKVEFCVVLVPLVH